MMHLSLASMLLTAAIVTAAARAPAPVPPPAAEAPAPLAATIDAAAFLKGSWSGAMGQDFVEEIWSGPRGKGVIGCFRWVKADGRLSMAELLSITEEDGTLVLRMRHHNGTLEGWKIEAETNTAMTLVLHKAGDSTLTFADAGKGGDLSTVSYTVTDGNTLAIKVGFKNQERRPLEFTLTRS